MKRTLIEQCSSSCSAREVRLTRIVPMLKRPHGRSTDGESL